MYFPLFCRHSFLPCNDIVNKCMIDKVTGEKRSLMPEDDDSDSDFGVD